jgi:phage terminase small subunit
LTVLRGNPSRKKLNTNEPVPPAGEVGKPAGLSEGAATVWDELAPICLAMRTLTPADVRVFRTLCELQATLDQASGSKDGRVLIATKASEHDGAPVTVVIDKVLKLERETAMAIRPYYALFGLEPISRARIQVPKLAEEPVSKWAGMLP